MDHYCFFFFIEKLVCCLIFTKKKKIPDKKYQSSWQLAILNYLPISKQYQNITGLTEWNDTVRIPKP